MQRQNSIRPEAQRDIEELKQKIEHFNEGEIPEDKFKHFRLTRGVYGQRQAGVQMIRIKLPYGKVTAAQLERMADVSEKYATGNLHLTTRQDIQLHFVKLENSPKVWEELEECEVTMREACGNTVRNVTASPEAGIDPHEPFDVTPYAHAFTHYFLRNPICQDMGRKFKAAFSSSEQDTGMTFFHDLGFIPRIREVDGQPTRGFKVVVGGGLGAQPFMAQTVSEFMPSDEYIPFAEAVLRTFDRHGERSKRLKARMKYLIKKVGLERFLELVEGQRKALAHRKYEVSPEGFEPEIPQKAFETLEVEISDQQDYHNWLTTNTFEQKQQGYHGVFLRIQNGDISSEKGRLLAQLMRQVAADDARVTANQGLLFKFVRKEALPYLYTELKKLGFGAAGFNSIHDITACPGSDTCNLAVTNSTGLTRALEAMLQDEYQDLVTETGIKIKISGCMNACGQHTIANIGFHGSSVKKDGKVAPAMQVLLGGGQNQEGQGAMADKVIKVPTKRAPEVVRILLNDYEENAVEGQYFNDYYQQQGKKYFYGILKQLADTSTLAGADFFDWEAEGKYEVAVGTGECAGIILDVVGTIIGEGQEKLSWAQEGLDQEAWADSIYNAYGAMVIGAKALLLSIDQECNTHSGIIADFDEHLVSTGDFVMEDGGNFSSFIYEMNEKEPSPEFAQRYYQKAQRFLKLVSDYRQQQLDQNKAEAGKQVVESYYKA